MLPESGALPNADCGNRAYSSEAQTRRELGHETWLRTIDKRRAEGLCSGGGRIGSDHQATAWLLRRWALLLLFQAAAVRPEDYEQADGDGYQREEPAEGHLAHAGLC